MAYQPGSGVYPRVEVFDGTFDRMEKAMEIATKRQAVIAHNIANADTPGYQALTFDNELQKAVTRLEQPSVNLEEEMAALTENSVAYSSYIKMMSTKLNVLKSVASQGRR